MLSNSSSAGRTPVHELPRSPMSLVRAFTTRRTKPDISVNTSGMVGRAASQRAGKPLVNRAQISSPVALVSTSNLLLNNARDIAGTRPIQRRNVSGSTVASTIGEESDSSVGSVHSDETAMTDTSSVEASSPITPVEPNHLSCYFKPAVDTETKASSHSRTSSATPSLDTPKIPQRVPSHSKRAHESVHRQRSIRRMMSPEPPSCEFARTSVEIATQPIIEEPKENPFGSELSQLEEVAEEFSHVVSDAEADADAKVLLAYGLAVFSATEYMTEIQNLVYQTFTVEEPAAWI
nr:hypothetical protein CFP56_52278 [Quercus suber]